jgi:GNAT superfamily N-acetyltransferase
MMSIVNTFEPATGNFQAVQVQKQEQLPHFCSGPGLPVLSPETVSRQKADAHWLLTNTGGELVARCSLWWRAAPVYRRQQLGLIGHYGASQPQAAAQLLSLACQQLAANGCTMAVGPMDGNTWHSYRLVTDRGSEPPFFLEPGHPPDWPLHFAGSGFTILSQYYSAVVPDLSRSGVGNDPRLARAAARAAARGLRIRSLRLEHFETELDQIYAIALAGFRKNFLYTPISKADFKALYYPLRAYIQPELILIAEQDGRAIGFIFAVPDLLQSRRRVEMDTVIIKTVAVHPEHQSAGLGSLLVGRCQEVAGDLGYRRAIHALMYEQNASRKISRRHETQLIRRYALFAREL